MNIRLLASMAVVVVMNPCAFAPRLPPLPPKDSQSPQLPLKRKDIQVANKKIDDAEKRYIKLANRLMELTQNNKVLKCYVKSEDTAEAIDHIKDQVEQETRLDTVVAYDGLRESVGKMMGKVRRCTVEVPRFGELCVPPKYEPLGTRLSAEQVRRTLLKECTRNKEIVLNIKGCIRNIYTEPIDLLLEAKPFAATSEYYVAKARTSPEMHRPEAAKELEMRVAALDRLIKNLRDALSAI